jgi:hypothetical protein
MDFSTPLGAFFMRIPLNRDGKSMKTNKRGGLQRYCVRNLDDNVKDT